ncbi:MAG: hypothetical protein U9Q62_01570 [Campylobacterota bacterium]|nr:hypothetical protein [Campylobacterota bacterium]
MEPSKTLHLKEPVLQLKRLRNGILCAVDAQTTIRFINLENFQVAGGVKANVIHKELSSNCIAMGPFGKVCATVIPDSNRVALFDVKQKRFLYEIDRHQGRVESVALDPKLRYMATGGQDGRLFVWSVKSGKMMATLMPHSDFITALCIDPEENIIASGSYDRVIHLNSIEDKKKTLTLRAHTSAVVALAFYGKTGLVSAGKNGEMIVWERRHGTLIKRLPTMHDEITMITLCEDGRILFVGTALGYVALYDMESYAQISDRYIKVKGRVLSMTCFDQSLALGTSTGELHLFALYGDSGESGRMLENEQYQQFYLRVSQNPLLAYSDQYEEAEMAWREALDEAKLLLEKGKTVQAQRLLEPFGNVKGKGSVAAALLEDQEAYQLFKLHVEEGRYSLAYAMLHQYPKFKESLSYQKMERLWQQLFAKARQLLESKKGEDQAKELLSPFRGISEKTVSIQQLFNESKRYLFFKDLIGKREWKKVFELVKNYPFLQEFKEYATVLDYADKLYIQLQKSYAAGDLYTTRQLCEILLDFPDYKDDVKRILDDL